MPECSLSDARKVWNKLKKDDRHDVINEINEQLTRRSTRPRLVKNVIKKKWSKLRSSDRKKLNEGMAELGFCKAKFGN